MSIGSTTFQGIIENYSNEYLTMTQSCCNHEVLPKPMK